MLWTILIVGLICIILWKFKRNYTYWQRNGINQLTLGQICVRILQTYTYKRKLFYELVQEAYEEFPQHKFNGIYQQFKPILLLREPELIKQLNVKDFDHFVDHVRFNSEEALWSKTLFNLKGEKWKNMRTTLSLAFTSSKMRSMFSLMSDCADDFVKYFEEGKSEVLDVELRDVFTRYTNDVIATCAFGVNCNSVRERENEFYMMGKQLTNFSSPLKNIAMMFIATFPKLSNKLLLEAKERRLVYEESSVNEASFATVLESDIGKSSLKQKEEITADDIIAQALGFFFAGFDSVAVLMCYIGYELAINPDIQERLQQEIDGVLEENRNITYEMVNKMKYLDMVVTETMRKWPAIPALYRTCEVPYDLPSENLKLNKGDAIWIPIWGLHRDPNYFPHPEKFDPERFSDDNKHNIKPYTYLPFGVGPRNCIASRFALLETKVVYIKLLSKFNIVVIEKTPIPMVLAETGFSLSPVNGFWVGLRPRN